MSTNPENLPSDLELRKMVLDERRLDFEIRQYEDAKTSRDQELVKLEEEIKELKRPFYTKAAYLTPAATIAVALIGGFIVFGTNLLKSNISSLLSQRKQLSGQVKSLTEHAAAIERANGDLRGNLSQLSDRIAKSQNEIQDLQDQKRELAAQLPLDRVEELLSVLKRKTSRESLETNDPSYQDIYSSAIAAGPASAQVKLILQKHNDADCPQTLKAGLSFILLNVTHDPQWKKRLQQESLDGYRIQVSTHPFLAIYNVGLFLAFLGDHDIFSAEDRTANLKELYNASGTPTQNRELIYTIATWDEDATIAFREPWLDYLVDAYKHNRNDLDIYSIGSPSLAGFSPQAYAVTLIDRIAHDSSTQPLRIEERGFFLAPQKCDYPPDLPLCADFVPGYDWSDRSSSSISLTSSMYSGFLVPVEKKSAYQKWESEHDRLVRLWVNPDIDELRSLPDDLFRTIFRRDWIKEDQLSK